ncbi:NOVA2 [Symbiodinium pilosum]|uniref:NOVA2 protein n=1 Tax=Symbiodinium pilosum TaxID=2952 RepID=A0A812KH00_SYMPI|nr:NOVA2 [Symbiodinium pilosum]
MGYGDGGKGMRRFAFKALCPNELVARIMGKGGTRKEQLQNEMGCKIVVSGRDECFPGTRYRVLLIYSDNPEAFLGVMQHVIGDIVECGAKEAVSAEADFVGMDRGSYIVRCVVTKQMSSAIIGPKGSNARAIREESGSKVVIDPNITAGHQTVKIVGEPHGLQIALSRVNQYVQEQHGTPSYVEWATVKSFDGAGNPIYASPAETGISYAGHGGHGHANHGKGSEWPDERERTPRGPGAPAQRAGPRSVVNPPQPASSSGDEDSDLLSALSSTAQGFPRGTLDAEYTITCELPREKVGLLIGKRGEDVQRIRKKTGTYIHFDPAQDGNEGQTLTIRGPLLKIYQAHALLMKRYHETQVEEAPPNGANGDKDQKVQALEEQLQALQRQMAEVKQMQQSNVNAPPPAISGKGKGTGKGARKGW